VPERLGLPAHDPVILPVLGALAASEAAVRLLRPRERPRPLPAAPADYFSAEEIERARRFRRGQRRLGWVRSALQAGLLAAAARRPPLARPITARGVTTDVR
jgi:hypothetical protein